MSAVLSLILSVLAPQQASAALPPAHENRLERVVVLGASMAAGFGAERTFGEAFEASLRGPHEPVLDLGNELFFSSPNSIGAHEVETALAAEPTLVVALDFLFWFGYGS